MKTIKALIQFVIILATLGLAQVASAQSLPNWCYDYTSSDSFDTWGNWGLWNVSNTGVTKIGPTGSNLSPPGAVLMSFGSSEPNGTFMALDRYFTLYGDINHQYNACSVQQPPPPSSQKRTSKFCSAEVSVRTPQGAHVAIQIIDPDTYAILSSKEIDLPVMSTWKRIWTPDIFGCRQELVVRLALVSTPTSKSVQFDNFRLDWWY